MKQLEVKHQGRPEQGKARRLRQRVFGEVVELHRCAGVALMEGDTQVAHMEMAQHRFDTGLAWFFH
ncbi:MAG: hypothetical protein ABI885_30030 [Gammaproteobacteria bacterium]